MQKGVDYNLPGVPGTKRDSPRISYYWRAKILLKDLITENWDGVGKYYGIKAIPWNLLV